MVTTSGMTFVQATATPSGIFPVCLSCRTMPWWNLMAFHRR